MSAVQHKVRVMCHFNRFPRLGEPEVVAEFDVPEMSPAPSTPEDAQAGRFEEARELRVLLGTVTGLPFPGEYVVRLDGFRQVLLSKVVDGKHVDEVVLSKNAPQAVGDYEMTCEQVLPPAPHRQDDRGMLQRLWHWLTRARCQKCFYFDQRQAAEWRDRITHSFDGVAGGADGALHERMNHDIILMEAAAHGVPDIPPEQFGYCTRRWIGLHGVLHPCSDYRRRKEA